MKTCRVCEEQKPIERFHRDKDKRDGRCSICKPCASMRAKAYYAGNADVIRERSARWHRDNPERKSVQSRQWVANNAAKSRAIKKKWQDANKERHNATTRKWAALNKERRAQVRAAWRAANAARIAATNAAWSRNNPGKRLAHKAARRAKERFATPAWANHFFIEEIYGLAALRSKITGVKWQVDHIVPLVSPLVCGLHVENNLQVIPAMINQSKNNRHWPNMPGGEHGAR